MRKVTQMCGQSGIEAKQMKGRWASGFYFLCCFGTLNCLLSCGQHRFLLRNSKQERQVLKELWETPFDGRIKAQGRGAGGQPKLVGGDRGHQEAFLKIT